MLAFAGVAQWQSRSFPSFSQPRASAIYRAKHGTKQAFRFKRLRIVRKTYCAPPCGKQDEARHNVMEHAMTDDDLHRPRPYCDWHEGHGDVLWWRIPISEAPYVGSPLDLGHSVEAEISLYASDGREAGPTKLRTQVGGWPFRGTSNLWWTPLPDAKRIEDQVPL